MKIFISIASYRDSMLLSTIESAFNNADEPSSLSFGICDQNDKPIDLQSIGFENQIKYELIDPKISLGACWARSRVQKMFSNEEYYLQIDSHTQFEQGWDSYLIKYLKKIQSVDCDYHKMPILTGYPRPFFIESEVPPKFRFEKSWDGTIIMAYKEDELFVDGKYCSQNSFLVSEKEERIHHGFLISAGFIFTIGRFVKDIPYDSNLYFHGEEMSLAIRSFTRGYSIFHIPNVPLYHLYNDSEIQEVKRPMHWDDSEDQNRKKSWKDLDYNSLNRLSMIISGEVGGIYGLGEKRTLGDYEHLCGINLKSEKVSCHDKAFFADVILETPWDEEPRFYEALLLL